MASVTLTFKTIGLPRAQASREYVYGAWRLECSATDAFETDGYTNTSDPNVFVIRTNQASHPDHDKEVFSHVASLYEMNNLPVSKSDAELLPPKLPPKVSSHYRSSLLKLDFMNTRDLEKAKADIQLDVDLLMSAASNESVLEEVSMGVETLAEDVLTVRWGVSTQAMNSLTQSTVDSFDSAIIGEEIGHSGELSPGAIEHEYIYVMYPAELPECDVFELGGFTTTSWPSSILTFEDKEFTPSVSRDYRIYRTNQKLGVFPGTISYDIHKKQI